MISKINFNNLLFSPHIVSSRNSTKAVQTKDRISSLDFPTPPPAVTDANEFSEQAPDGYLSLKLCGSDSSSLYPNVHISSPSIVTYFSFSRSICQQELDRTDRLAETQDRNQKCERQKIGDKDRDEEKELMKENEQEKGDKQKLNQELNVLEEKAKRLRDSKISRDGECIPSGLRKFVKGTIKQH